MPDFIAKYQDDRFVVYKGDSNEVFGSIVFDEGRRVSAYLQTENTLYRAEPESETDKDIVIRRDGAVLFKFKFDYVWGGAELYMNGEDTGYDVTGKFFMPGTRFTDKEHRDLIVAVSDEQEPPETVIDIVGDEEVSPLMVMATLYYHLYASAGKRLVSSLTRIV